MTEFDIQKVLFSHFLTLNEFSGIDYLEIDGKAGVYSSYKNVHFPNLCFSVPSDKRYFDLTFRSNEPIAVGIQGDSQNRFTGVFYIDIIVPQDTEEAEVECKYKWVANLFRKGSQIDFVDINNVYISTKGNDADCYRLQIAIEWEADIDKE